MKKLVEPVAKRDGAAHFIKSFDLSQRRACESVSLQHCIYRYRSRRTEETPVRERLKQLAVEHPRWGYRFLCTLLCREGHGVNHKRVSPLSR